MALQAVAEVAVHFGTFRNVDLFHQGLYHLHCQVFTEHDGRATYAVPHIFVPPSRTGVQPVLPAAVVKTDASAAFRTKTVLIRYCEEEPEINDVAQFRIEQDAGADSPVMLEVKLMFADITRHGIDLFDAEGSSASAEKMSDSEFHAVSSQQFQLHGVRRGLHAYCPVVFDEFHFCRVGLMVHSTLLDFRLRLPQGAPLSPYLRPGIAVKRPATMAEALFELGSGEAEADAGALARAADRVQAEYLGRLAASHAALGAFLRRLGELIEGRAPGPIWALPPLRFRAAPGSDSAAPLSCREASAQAAVRRLTEDLSFVASQLREAWHAVLAAASAAPEDVSGLLHGDWELQVRQRCAASILREECPASHLAVPQDFQLWSAHARAAAELRQSQQYRDLKPHVLEDLSLSPPQAAHPILFEQRYAKATQTQFQFQAAQFQAARAAQVTGEAVPRPCPARRQGLHVFVLVHGFQGHSCDMRLLKNHIALLHPDALCLCSTANEEDTECDIGQMGVNLAEEVRAFLRDWCGPPAELGRLSFIGHSVGGLIVRSALPLLPEVADRMFTFVSFSSPHLGYVYPSNSLFKTGLWVAKKLRRSLCLEQLSMTDSEDRSTSFLCRLAELPGLEHFQHVMLVSSYQDQYAPFESARMEMSPAAQGDPSFGPLYTRMLSSLLDPLRAERVIRCDVNFHIPETNLDTMIGRAAHIQFIESQPLMKVFLHSFRFLFA